MSWTCQSTTNRIMIWVPICLFLAVFAVVNSETAIEPNQPPNAPSNPSLKDGDKCNAESFNKIMCENDRYIFCGPTNQIVSSPCMINGRQGFCNCEKTGCVAEKPSCDDETDDCLAPKTKLPDNLNCHKFSYCNENSKKVILECPGNLVYDPNTQKCTDQSKARCARVACPRFGSGLKLIPFPQARNYYLLCYQGIGDVRKCSDKFYSVQNNACQFDCRMKNESGVFKDTNLERCKRGIYYTCKKTGGSYVTIQSKCLTGMYFDDDLGVCTTTDTCQPSTNTL